MHKEKVIGSIYQFYEKFNPCTKYKMERFKGMKIKKQFVTIMNQSIK